MASSLADILIKGILALVNYMLQMGIRLVCLYLYVNGNV